MHPAHPPPKTKIYLHPPTSTKRENRHTPSEQQLPSYYLDSGLSDYRVSVHEPAGDVGKYLVIDHTVREMLHKELNLQTQNEPPSHWHFTHTNGGDDTRKANDYR